MNWAQVVQQAELNNAQNRLGYILGWAFDVAGRMQKTDVMTQVFAYKTQLEEARLAKEDTLCHEDMTQAERKWLRLNRSEPARHWNLLTNLEADHLAYAM